MVILGTRMFALVHRDMLSISEGEVNPGKMK